jgi:ubiquinone/menaquinone biosynthesis C-methylase UbiE
MGSPNAGVAEDNETAVTARRGNPSFVWRAGQERRMDLVKRYVPLDNKLILDAGCGVGLYVNQFARISDQVYGIDIENNRLEQARVSSRKLCIARAEALPFVDRSFDVVFSHEVLEHVDNDRMAVAEAVRVTRDGGYIVIFVPNRLFPFETHGCYFRGAYRFGNIPLINYLPDVLRRRFCPHVRAYTRNGLRQLWANQPVKVIIHREMYPGFDNIAARRLWLSGALRRILYFCEGTPLSRFGLSHFAVLQREVI